MQTLAIDIGGTKFTLAAFEADKLRLRESRSTERSGGPEWMLSQIEQIFHIWRDEHGFRPSRCGIGFGGPVDFPTQTVTLSTHVEGWMGYPLVAHIERLTGAPVIMDNDANVGALGESAFGAGYDFDPLFYLT